MKKQLPASRSIANQFTRHYLIVSIIPIVVLLVLIIIGAVITSNYLTDLITKSTYDLNQDAEQSLQQLGEEIIISKARDVARQAEVYFRSHPNMDITQMRKDPRFMEFALQKVGKTGYTSFYEAGTWIFRVHPNQKLIDKNVVFLAKTLPSWWALVGATHSGNEVYGYYDWRDSDGSIHKKFMCITPARVKLKDKIIMIAATTYIDEFSMPLAAMKNKADKVVGKYLEYVSRTIIIFGFISAGVLFLTFLGIYFLGRHAGLRYIMPITNLAETANKLGEGKWDVQLPDIVLEREDEIGIMAQSFNRMSQQLKDTFSRLEQRVTELRQTQDALKASEEHYRSLFDGIPVGLYRSSPEGIFLDANPALATMLGYPDKNALMSRRTTDIYGDPNDRTVWISRMKEGGGIQAHEVRMNKKDGAQIWVENSSRAVHDESGSVLYYEGSIKDTTERREANAALKKSEANFKTLYEESQRAQEVYRSLINSSADAIVIFDMKEHVTYVSPMFTAIFGWHTEELISKPLPFVPESEKASTMNVVSKLIETGTPCQDFETRRLTKDGRIIDVSVSASRYNDHEGKPAGMLFMLRDISEAKQMKEHLQQVERLEAIATLAGGVAHDFNNLLTVIQGTISLLLHSTPVSDENYKHFINIEKQVTRGSSLTKQLLGYARKGKYDVKVLLLNDLIRENAETLRQTRKDIRIHYHLADDLHNVEADVYQMEQVLMNLFINAADAMNAGGDLLITTKNIHAANIPEKLREAGNGDYVLFTVEDTGTGMDKKTMTRIFEPFFTTKAVNKGTGLGLASVYGIVKSHGGTIDVASQPGVGSIFSIYLPASDKTIPLKISQPKKALQGKGTILLIDDEKPVLEITAEMLQSMGYIIMKAETGCQALEIYRQNSKRIDLVILDMIMPDMSGGNVFDRLREMNPHVVVLLSSGYSIDGKAMEILNRGCNGFIQKPFSMEELSEIVVSTLKA